MWDFDSLAADELNSPKHLETFTQYLAEHDLYVFTLNGFPYGPFHGKPVKTKVYVPDWRSAERLRYTKVLADILAALLPPTLSLQGSISTLPGAFKPDIQSPDDISRMTGFLVDAVIHLIKLREKTGKWVTLALEPEPFCFLERVEEAIAFFQKDVFSAKSVQQIVNHTGLQPDQAESALRNHIGVCLDVCHAAVEFEDPDECLAALRQAGISIFKMQISAGLQVASMTPHKLELLRQLQDPIYLHQVVSQTTAGLVPYLDLNEAFSALETHQHEKGREWRIHFHVPIFLRDLGEFSTTQDFLCQILNVHRRHPVSAHLEVETYTWDVIPSAYKTGDVISNICREMAWVQSRLQE